MMCAERRKVEMTQEKINALYRACGWLEGLLKQMDNPLMAQQYKTNRRFTYAVAYNQDTIEKYVRAFDKSVQSDKEFDAYEEARMKLVEKHGKRDGKGELIMRDESYVMKDQIAFNKDLDKLREKHPAFQARQDMLEETHKIDFHMVMFRFVPDWLPFGVMRLMKVFIEHEPDELECPKCRAALDFDEGGLVLFEEEDEIEEEPEPPKKVRPIDKAKARKKRRRTG